MRELVIPFPKAPLAVLLLALGCQQTKLVVQNEAAQVDTFDQATRAQTDILWVVDNSGSMAREQDQLAASFPKFFTYLQGAQLDYRIGVTTTDVITFPTQAGNLVGTPQVIVGNSTDPRVPDTLNPTDAFAVNIHVGTNGSARDEALEAAATAIQNQQVAAGTAQDAGAAVLFLRPTAALFLIFVGDGIDYSPDYDLDGVTYYWREYLQAKGIGNNGLVQVGAIAGPQNGTLNGCYPQICSSDADGGVLGLDTDAGLTPFGERYYELVELAGGLPQGLFGDICDCNFDQTLENLGLALLALSHKFRLSRPANPTTLVVTVDYPCSTSTDNLICIQSGLSVDTTICTGGYGANCSSACSALGLSCIVPQADPADGGVDGWTYNPGDNSITFSDRTLPPAGTEITVSYGLAGTDG